MNVTKSLLLAFALPAIAGASFLLYKRYTTGASLEQRASNNSQIDELPSGLSLAEYRHAEKRYSERYAPAVPTRAEVLSLAGDMAAAERRVDTAIACYRAIPTQHPRLGLAARLQEGLLLVEENRAREAERALRDYVDAARIAPELKAEDVVTAFKWLNYILSVEVRLEERKIFLSELHSIGLADPLDSKQYFFPNLLILNSPAGRTRLKAFLAREPNNLNLQLAQGRYKTLEGQFDEAVVMLENLFVQHPENLHVAASLLEAYFESNALAELDKVLSGLPMFAASEPWLLTRMRGEAAAAKQQHVEALRYFGAVLENDPANAPSQMGLVRAYAATGNKTAHSEAIRRSATLAEIRVNLRSVQPDAGAAARELAEKCKAIGFQTAAEAFMQHAQAIDQSATRLNPTAK